MYEFLDAAVVRAPAWRTEFPDISWPDLTGSNAAPASGRTWLEAVWQIPEFALAVEAASPDLARQVAKILKHDAVPDTAVRRVVVSVLRYLLRAQTRATPFGLLAGIAPVRIGDATAIRTDNQHRTATRPDAVWLDEQIAALETDPTLLPHLSVIANNLAVHQRQHLVLAHRPSAAAEGTPERVQIRATPPVLAALDTATRPIRVVELAEQLAERFPVVPSRFIDGLIAKLVAQQFLLTNLHPATTEPDPLAAVLRILDALSLPDGSDAAMLRTSLHAVQMVLSEHDRVPHSTVARNSREQAAALMRTPAPCATDLLLGWDITIPMTVAAEAAQAAGVMARLARRPALNVGWADWHARFLDRYGPRAVVSVCEAVDADAGLGYPAGYLDSSHAVPPSPITDRDKLLLKLAHRATVCGDLEVILNDQLISELSVVTVSTAVQPSAEVTVRIHAESARDLDDGWFELHVTGISRGVGTTTGRFLHLLDDVDRKRIAAAYAASSGAHDDTLAAQLSAAPLHVRTGNVSHARRIDTPVISLGEYHDPGGDQIPITDLAVTADATRLHLISLSRKCPVHPMLLNAVDLAYHSHPLTRFLVEVSNALAAPCTGFEWGAAHVLPFLPAMRYRRTLLSPARWNLSDEDVRGSGDGYQEWDTAFAAWQRQVHVPDWVYLGDGDQCIRIHLTEPSHRALLRDQLHRSSRVMLRTAPKPKDLGWADGRIHEIAIPVRSTRCIAPVRWSDETTDRHHSYLPTLDGRLYLKLHSNHGQQDEIVIRHVPDLQQRLGTQLARCWFIRYDHPNEQLRLRLALESHALVSSIKEVSTWTERLRDEGLVSSVSWETYFPETARFGGSAAIGPAEAFFTADSTATIAQLVASTARHGPDVRALTAASLIDIVVAFIGDEDKAMRWLIGHTVTDAIPPPRLLYKEAVALSTTRDVGADVVAAWDHRRAALTAYRDALHQAGTITPEDLLPDLLHLHHARVNGPDLAAERRCLHLARAAALSRIARTRRMQPA